MNEWMNYITEAEAEKLAQRQQDAESHEKEVEAFKTFKRRLADTARARMRKEKQRERF